MIKQEELFEKYHLDNKYSRKTKEHWKELEGIHEDYLSIKDNLETHASFIAASLRKSRHKVHSVKFRTKNPEHLIAKIIARDYVGIVNRGNYRKKITDLIGLRALHLFKDDWIYIHEFINKHWRLSEKPTANIREGDPDEIFKKAKCKIKIHPAGYRSVHYLIKTELIKELQICEIQVRTIFEEGWSEIDHTIRYPHNLGNEIINQFLVIFNRLAGSADEMGSFIKLLQIHFEGQQEKSQKTLQEHSDAISRLKEKIELMGIEKTDKNNLKSSLEDLDKLALKQTSIREELEKFDQEAVFSDLERLRDIFFKSTEKML